MLIDTGPLVSLCDHHQPDHSRCRAVLQSSATPLISTWACFVEAMHLLGRTRGFVLQRHLWSLLNDDTIRLHEHDADEPERMAALMERYQNVPMDLADASLVVLAEILNDREMFTLDSDFLVYRLSNGGSFRVVPGGEFIKEA